jgi:hypothetical protein
VHNHDKDILFRGKKLTIRGQTAPITRTGGCWPVHVGDVNTPTLTRCNITSWPQSWRDPANSDSVSMQSLATTVQTWPESRRDSGGSNRSAYVRGFHGASKRPIPSSEGGDYSDPGDAPRATSEDLTCAPLGCILNFSGSGNLQGGINTNVTVKGARFVFVEGDEVILRDLDIRGSSPRSDDFDVPAEEGGCLYASGNVAVTVVDSVFAFCRATVGGGAVSSLCVDIYMYMYVCVYIYIYIHTYICTYTHTHTHTHTH